MKTALLMAGLLVWSQVPASAAISVSALTTIQQPHPPGNANFLFLRGHKEGRMRYGLQWNMTTNAGIDHFVVQATYEDPTDPYSNWYILGTVNNSRNNIFRFTHSNILPGIINYRVIAVMRNQSGTLYSPILTCSVGQ